MYNGCSSCAGLCRRCCSVVRSIVVVAANCLALSGLDAVVDLVLQQ